MQNKDERLVRYFEKRGGYVRLRDWKRDGFDPSELKSLHQQGFLVKIKNGLYRLSEFKNETGFPMDFIDACRALPDGIVTLTSALHYHGLISTPPTVVVMAVPHNKRVPCIHHPQVQILYFRDRFYQPGIKKVETPYGWLKIYDREKAVCDAMRYRKKVGEPLAIEALKNYVRQNTDSGFSRLQHFARICQVKRILTPYLKALVYSL